MPTRFDGTFFLHWKAIEEESCFFFVSLVSSVSSILQIMGEKSPSCFHIVKISTTIES